MKSKTITSSNWNAIPLEYSHDDEFVFSNNVNVRDNGNVSLNLNQTFSDLRDNTFNQFSSLYLTKTQTLSSILTIDTPAVVYPIRFVTYLSLAWWITETIDQNSKLLTIIDDTQTETMYKNRGQVASFGLSGLRSDGTFSNGQYFEIELVDANSCYVTHDDSYKISYLTYDSVNDIFYFDFKDNSKQQLLQYQYDTELGYIRFLSQSGRALTYSTFAATGSILSPRGGFVNFTYSSGLTAGTDLTNAEPNITVWKCASLNVLPINQGLVDNWVSYKPGVGNINVNVNPDKKITNLSNNFLLHNEYDPQQSSNKVNIITLKNQMDLTNNPTRDNPFVLYKNGYFPSEETSTVRDYTKIFSGSNQIYGNDNIALGFNDFTSHLVLKTNEITYFHMPQSMFPYKKLNVNDSTLITNGAIGGDIPIRSDKLYKKNANYKDHSNWGNSTDQNYGTYLCTWLYWNGLSSSQPVWLDRYYNSELYSTAQVLTSKDAHLITYKTRFDTISEQLTGCDQCFIFDKVSDLTFEPGVLYAYYRIGQADVSNFITSISGDLVQYNLDTFTQDNVTQYQLNGSNYGKTKGLDKLTTNNSINYNFYAYSDDWSKPFGHHIMGNYTDSGMGVFNKKIVTPFISYIDDGKLHITNTDMVSTKVIDLPYTNVKAFAVKEFLEGIFIVSQVNNQNHILMKYDINGRLLDTTEFSLPSQLTFSRGVIWRPITTYAHDFDNIYLYQTNNLVYEIELSTGNVQYAPVDRSLQTTKNNLEVVNGETYGYYGQEKDVDASGNILYKNDNLIYKYDTTERTLVTAFSATYDIRHFKTDVSDNIYLLYRGRGKYFMSKFDKDREHLFTKPLSSIHYTLSTIDLQGDTKFDIIAEPLSGQYIQSLMLLAPSNNKVNQYKFTFDGDIHEYRVTQCKTSMLSTSFFDSNYKLLKNSYSSEISSNYLYFDIRLHNRYNPDNSAFESLKYDVKGFDRGWHHFSYDFDSESGLISLIIDGNIVATQTLPAHEYRFSPMDIQPFVVGGVPTFHNELYHDTIKQDTFGKSTNMVIKDLYIYNKSLNYFDVRFHTIKQLRIRDIHWNVPSGKRNYLDQVERTFKHRYPGRLSERYDLNIISDTLSSTQLRQQLQTDIQQIITKYVPANSTINNINWIDQ